jgi:HNH endonuclease
LTEQKDGKTAFGDRVPIPNRIRFEVFKRDKFTCRYCGASAPDVVLNCDHVKPVAAGGETDIINLITSCKTCNSGKGAIPLSDGAAVEKQRAMLADLEERRQQIEMMVQWREELRGLATDTVDAVASHISSRSQFVPNENGRANIRRWLKTFTVDEILRASDEAFDTYLAYVDDKATTDSWEFAFEKIPGIIRTQRQEGQRPYLRRLYYIQGIIRKRTRATRYQCIDYLEHIHLNGMALEEMEEDAKRIRTIDDFEGPYDGWLKSIGKPF